MQRGGAGTHSESHLFGYKTRDIIGDVLRRKILILATAGIQKQFVETETLFLNC